MIPVRLEQIIGWCGGRLEGGSPAQMVTGVSTDSRTIKPGALFVALPGARFDGHDFVRDVLRKKRAVAAVVRSDFPAGTGCLIKVPDTLSALGKIACGYRKQFQVEMIAVTGSAGKTTAKELIKRVLSSGYQVLASPGNFNNQIGLPLSLLKLRPEHRFCVIEMGMNHPGEIDRLSKIALPSCGVITTIGRAHAGFFKNLREIALAKGELLVNLQGRHHAFLNADAAYYRLLKTMAPGPVTSFGTKRCAGVRGFLLEESLFSFRFRVAGYAVPFRMKFWNPAWIYTALAAIAVGQEFGISGQDIAGAISSLEPLPGRGKIWKLNGITLIDESYNCNPDSLKQALVALARKKAKRTVAIIGDMAELGKRSHFFHTQLGRILQQFSPGLVLLVGKEIVAAAVAAGQGPYHHFNDVESLQRQLPRYLHPGDLVLVKGSRAMGLEKVVSFLQHHYRRNHVC
ncbi:MAG TPA: UDP-N-acetylmuramoyl-tripeptide--D-alanyl-D-alanine ligase [bacterium]|nr:UDP-N-acetylmuramoyl-tripeptide--D-alanyl-D-alanine ligase [bacterium]